MDEKVIEKITNTYLDWYGKHKIGSRFAMIAFVIVYVMTSIYPLVVNIKARDDIFIEILHTTSFIAMVAFITTVVGANTLIHLAEIYRDIKLGKKIKEEE